MAQLTIRNTASRYGADQSGNGEKDCASPLNAPWNRSVRRFHFLAQQPLLCPSLARRTKQKQIKHRSMEIRTAAHAVPKYLALSAPASAGREGCS
jgi:hypothetical protein